MRQSIKSESADHTGTPAKRDIHSGPPETLKFPLSFAEQRLWFLDKLEPGKSVYNVPEATRLTGPLQVECLEKAINEIVRRHEALRTSFSLVDGRPMQVVAPSLQVPLSICDLQHLGETEREQAVARETAELGGAPFDLQHGPLLRATLFVLRRDEHVLMLVMHHIVSEGGWSMSVFLREMGVLYNAYFLRKDSPLPELPIQYGDYSVWQRNALQGKVLEPHVTYWKSHLQGAPALVNWSADRQRPAVQTYNGARQSIFLGKDLKDALNAFARKEGVTLFMALLAAFQILLFRSTAEEDLVVGVPVAGRTPETQNLIGLFLNTIALRTRFSGELSFRQFVKQVRQVVFDGLAHQDLPFEMLVEAIRPVRSLAFTPLFQVMFAFQNAPHTELKLTGIKVTPFEVEIRTSMVDLTFFAWEKPEGLKIVFEYSTNLFEPATIDRMLAHLGVLLDGIVRNPDERLARLPLLTEPERRQLLVEWNETHTDYSLVCTHHLFEAQCRNTPNAVAAIHESRPWMYAELNGQADRIAHHLKTLGAGPGTVVAICVERSLEMLAAMLGIWKAGAAYLPLDPSYPKQRLSFILEDAQPTVLLTERRLRAVLPDSAITVAMLEDCRSEDGSNASSSAAGDIDSLAYLIYTSGSTGKPKGVAIAHRALTNLLQGMSKYLDPNPNDRLLAVSTISFDIAGLELFLPLITGASVEIVSREVASDGARLAARIEKSGATIMQATPATWQMLGESGWKGKKGLKIVCGGEAMPKALAEQLLERGRVWNVYGPTETTIWSTICELSADNGNPSIGRPIANTQLYVLDREQQPAPIGVPGELYIGGDGLAQGYWKQPTLTAEKFVPSPFGPSSGSRLYATGDLVRYRPNGDVEYMGRIDNQVKVRGFRIELDEIETVLGSYECVGPCVVVVREDIPGEKTLVAYFESRAGSAPDSGDLRTHLKKVLPEYMVPSAFVLMQKLPSTPNGKIDRNALPIPTRQTTSAVPELIGPRSETEHTLAAIWAEVLRVEDPGVNNSFFDLGGHSLLAIKIVSRIRDALDLNLSTQALFEHPTIAELAAVVEELKGATAASQRIERRKSEGPSPLSYPQQQLWFLDQLAPGSPVYNIVYFLRFEGRYNGNAMRQTLEEIVRRHESLRTKFSYTDRGPMQTVVPGIDLPLREVDLSSLDAGERESEWKRVVTETGRQPFDLTQAPAFRMVTVHMSGLEHGLLLVIHHIIADEWSIEIFHHEVRELFKAFSRRRPSPLPELPIQYADFASWHRDWIRGDLLESETAYWKGELAGAPLVLEIPTDKPRPAVQSFSGATEVFDLPVRLSEQLKAIGHQQQATLFMVLAASFMALLHRYAGQDDMLVGTPISGRTRSETENLIGYFLNPVVLRAQFNERITFRSLLQQVRDRALRAYAHPDMPFDRLVTELAPERDASQSPLFQVMFVLHNPEGGPEISQAFVSPELQTGTSKFDITLTLSEIPTGLRGMFEYSTDLFVPATIRRMCGHFQTLLESIARNPDQRISEMPMLTENERQELLIEWNDTAVVRQNQNTCLHQLFEAQAARTPERTALTFGPQEMSYRELNERASVLAAHLKGLGVKPDDLVGLLVDRSLDLVVGLLGILKAGGAYVPLDPSFPENRLSYMIENSRMTILVTHHGLEEKLTRLPSMMVRLDSGRPLASNRDAAWADAAPPPPDEKNLAYVLYTSGSTGKPKGVAIPHSSIVNFVLSMWKQPGFSGDDTLLAVTTPSFDIAGLELYVPLTTGGKVVIASNEDTHDPARLQERIQESRCTVMQATPATWRALIHSGWKGSSGLKILCGGEALPRDLADDLLVRCGELWNMYGPTESTVWSAIHRIHPGNETISVGRPIENTQVYVLDKNRNLVPRGATGELYIGGDGLARGYLNRDDLTRERFVPNPFARNALMYRTGDLARWLPDGTLECLGRADNQVKLRGFRIELGEIEAVLSAHDGIKQCAVIIREDVPGDKKLVAYFEPKGAAAPSADELRARLERDLPAYMVPSLFVPLPKLPLTPNGKIDRNAMPERSMVLSAGDAADTDAPRDPLEKMLAQVWSKVLGIGRVGVHDNFFDIGGHSLLAVRIVVEVEKFTGTRLPLATLLQAPTVGGLAEILRRKNWTPTWSSLVPIRPGGSKPPLFLIHSHGGNVMEYYPLANELDLDQPVYALQARGLDGKIPQDISLEEMATTYLKEIRSFQPEGPYYLGGFCFGGVVALEAAHQLNAVGAEVATLLLIQSTHPDAARFKPGLTLIEIAWHLARKRISLEAENISHRGSTYFVDQCRHVLGRLWARIEMLRDRVAHREKNDLTGMPMYYILEALGSAHLAAFEKYKPRPYAGKVVLFRARKQLKGLNSDEDLGWRKIFSGRYEIIEVPGHQQNLLAAPNVDTLAKEIGSRLAAAQARYRPAPAKAGGQPQPSPVAIGGLRL